MCQKVPYETKQDAAKDAIYIARCAKRYKTKMPKSNRKLKPYFCKICDKWHLTTTRKYRGK